MSGRESEREGNEKEEAKAAEAHARFDQIRIVGLELCDLKHTHTHTKEI